MFKLWSESNSKIKEQLKPNLGIRDWNDLNKEEKVKIWKYLEKYFFDYNLLLTLQGKRYSEDSILKNIFGSNFIYEHLLKDHIYSVINSINERYKYETFAKKFHNNKNLLNACLDFYEIFINNDKDVVYELLSLYSMGLFILGEKNDFSNIKEGEDINDFKKRKNDNIYKLLDIFSKRLNEVFGDFGLDILLTRQGLIPKQGEKIIEEIYKPTLDFLSDNKWKLVNRDLGDAFTKYQNKDFSGCLTHTISAIQGFLQINIDGKLSNLSIKDGIKESKKKGIIPDDIFTDTIFKNIDSIISRERQEKGDPHPKKEYANEQNARLILNLSMVFMQHFIQIKK